MRVKSFHRSLRARSTVARHKLVTPMKYLAGLSKEKIRSRDRKQIWTLISRAFFVLIAVLLLDCTAIDILHQSFSSGQFWNSIIVVVCFGILIVWCVGLSFVRQIDVYRSTSAIPRQHQVNHVDIGGRMMQRILEARQRCVLLFKNQKDFSKVEHAGLQNPLKRHGGEDGEGNIEIPYWEFADTIPTFVEDTFTIIVPDFTIPPSSSLRDYIGRAITEKLLDPLPVVEELNRFLELYEQLRYSGNSLSHAELLEMMSALWRILNQVQQPDMPGPAAYQLSRSGTQTPTPSYTNSNLARTVSTSSYDSVRIYPTQTSVIYSSSIESGM